MQFKTNDNQEKHNVDKDFFFEFLFVCLLKGGVVVHCKVIIGRNPIEANANTVAIQLPGNPVVYIRKCFTPY